MWNVKKLKDGQRTGNKNDLIETLWNVKMLCNRPGGADDEDLIETLWNVKEDEVASYVEELLGFNRDIVECKVPHSRNSLIFNTVI